MIFGKPPFCEHFFRLWDPRLVDKVGPHLPEPKTCPNSGAPRWEESRSFCWLTQIEALPPPEQSSILSHEHDTLLYPWLTERLRPCLLHRWDMQWFARLHLLRRHTRQTVIASMNTCQQSFTSFMFSSCFASVIMQATHRCFAPQPIKSWQCVNK